MADGREAARLAGIFAHGRPAAFRVLYIAKFEEAIYVLHAFQKRTRRTGQVDIELARKRLRDLEHERRRR